MKSGRLKFLFLFMICFFMLKGLVYSSTGDHSITARNDSLVEQPNFTTKSESDQIAVGSDQHGVRVTNNNHTVSTAPTKESPMVEVPRKSKVEIEGDQNSGPGVATFIIFFVVIAWLTTVGGPKEN
jgi:hypothetical protein